MLKKMRWRVILYAMLAFSAVIILIALLVNIVNYVVVTQRVDQTMSYIMRFEENLPMRMNPGGNPGVRAEGRQTGRTENEPQSDIAGGEEGLPKASPAGKAEGGPQGNPADRSDQGPSGVPQGGFEMNPADVSEASADGGSEGPRRGPFMELPDLESNYMTRFFVVRLAEDQSVSSIYRDYIASIDEEEALRYAQTAVKKKSDKGYIDDYRYARKQVGDTTILIFLNVSREIQSVRSLRSQSFAVSGASLMLVFALIFIFSGRAIRPIVNNIERQKQFITDASHELKTPLTSISTSMDVITLEYGEDEWTENIRNQTSRMSKLVSELVALSRLDEANPLPNKENFSVSNAAWEIAEVYQPQAKGSGKNMTVSIQDDVSLVGDKGAIQQMLSVLLDNAIRYSDENGEIRFSLFKKRGKVHIEVFNTCHYDTPPDAKRLFDRFYRPDSSRNKETGGTGVGLAIAKAVAETHGGTISASCPSGKTMSIKAIL